MAIPMSSEEGTLEENTSIMWEYSIGGWQHGENIFQPTWSICIFTFKNNLLSSSASRGTDNQRKYTRKSSTRLASESMHNGNPFNVFPFCPREKKKYTHKMLHTIRGGPRNLIKNSLAGMLLVDHSRKKQILHTSSFNFIKQVKSSSWMFQSWHMP